MKREFKATIPVLVTALIMLVLPCQDSYSQSNGLTLENALNLAYSNSPTIRRTILSLTRSEELLNAQRAALKSSFTLNVTPFSYKEGRDFNTNFGAFYRTEDLQSSAQFNIVQPIVATDATVSLVNSFGWRNYYNERNEGNPLFPATTSAFTNNLSVRFDQPIFTYNRTKLQLSQLEFNLENTKISHELSKLSLERSVTQSFYSVYQQQQSLEISKKAYDNMQESYEVSKAKAEAGISADVELYQAELNLANSRSDYENRLVSLENVKDDFKVLVGMSLYDDFVVLPDISVDTIAVDVAFAIEQGLKNRLELRQRQISIETAQFDMIQTMALNEFKGNVGLTLGLTGDDEQFGEIYSTPARNQSVLINLTVPLWDWGEKKARIKASEASILTQELALEDEENGIVLGIRKVYRNLLNLRNQIDIAKQSTINADLTYQINLEKYKNGDLTGMDLDRSQEQLSQSQISYTNALISYKLELLNLKIQTLYDFEKKMSVTPTITTSTLK